MKTAVRILLLGSTDPDAREWASRVSTAGGSVGGTTLKAVSDFIKACKSGGIWSKMVRANLLCGDQLTAARVPLVVGGGSSTETVTNIVSGDYVETGTLAGIKGNGTDKSFDTGWNPVTASANSSSLGLWAYVKGTESAGTTRLIMGCSNGTTSGFLWLGWGNTGSVEIGSIAGLASAQFTPAAGSSVREGLLGVTTNGSRDQQYYQNGTAEGAAVTASGAFFNSNLVCLARNGPASFSTRYLRAYLITTGLSAAEAAALNTAMQTFQTALGRNV